MTIHRRRRVLVVEDDENLQESYRRFFERTHAHEFLATVVPSGEQALDVVNKDPVDIVVLDWTLPGISGASLAKAFRSHAKTRAIGILMVTGKCAVGETVFALECGADDYLCKPFDWSVLLARLRSLARRSDLTLDRHLTKSFPGLQLDFDSDRLTVDGQPVRLTPKEMDLFKILLMRPDMLHEASYLWQAVWGCEAARWKRILIVNLSSLRRKLGPRWGRCLKPHKGRGYIFETLRP